jgi:hypothetical protein
MKEFFPEVPVNPEFNGMPTSFSLMPISGGEDLETFESPASLPKEVKEPLAHQSHRHTLRNRWPFFEGMDPFDARMIRTTLSSTTKK